MTLLSTTDLQSYLESQHDYKIVGMIDIDQLVEQPRKTLYQLLKQWHKPVFKIQERIVLYSRYPVSVEVLTHIQKTASLIDISNFFILICSTEFDTQDLDTVRKLHSTDNCVFSTLEIAFTDKIKSTQVNATLSLPDTFCFNPWANLEISSQGEFKPCCVYKESIKDSAGRSYNINVDSLESVYHSNYMTNLRAQFLAGQQPAGCSNCWMKEQHGGQSNRHWSTNFLGLNAHCLHIEEDSVKNLISLDIKLGNLCNFRCRICNPQSSSRIAEEMVRHFDSVIDLKVLNQYGQWAENIEIWKTLELVGNHLVNIDFYGGEPFLIKQHEIFLNYLIERGHAPQMRLHYNSNGSIYPKHLFGKWSHFKEVDISFSIDNIGIRFELERGGSWNEVDKNLDLFIKSRLTNMVLSIYATVGVQNIYYLDQLIDWYETKDFNLLTFQLLEVPSFMSVVTMGNELSDLILEKLATIDAQRLAKYNLTSFVELIKQSKNLPDKIDQLADYMLKLDNIRNQDFNQTHPEIARIIYKGNKHGQTI